MPTQDGKTAGIADAFARLTARGVPVTVRSLKAEARCSTDAASAWLKANRTPEDAPAVPEGFAATVWPLAYAAARDMAVDAVAAQLDAARDAEAQATTDAEAAQEAQHLAEQRADDAERRAVEAEHDAAQRVADVVRERDTDRERANGSEAEARELRAECDRLAQRVREQEARASRAEAVADTMRDLVTQLRDEVRAAIHSSK